MIDDGVETSTSQEQKEVESEVAAYFSKLWKHLDHNPSDISALSLNKGDHARYVRGALGKLPSTPSSRILQTPGTTASNRPSKPRKKF